MTASDNAGSMIKVINVGFTVNFAHINYLSRDFIIKLEHVFAKKEIYS